MGGRLPRAELALTLGIVGAAAIFVLGAVPLPGAGPVVRVPLFLLVFFVAPGLLWAGARSHQDSQGIERIGSVLVLGSVHDLIVMVVLAAAGLGLRFGLGVWCVTLLLPVVARRRKGGSPSPVPEGEGTAGTGTMVFFGLAIALAVWMGATGARPTLRNDGPAHQGGIVDAIEADTWLPPDRSFGENTGAVDPRFGLGHGLYAAASVTTASDPADVLRYAPVVVAPLGLLAHAWLFLRFGLPLGAALLASVVFTVSGTGERGFGLWSAGYPGNLGLLLATLGLASWLASWFGAAGGGRLPRARWAGPALVALTVTVHPFAWWAFLLLVGHGSLLLLIRRSQRAVARGFLVSTAGCLVLGVLLVLPRWLDQAQAGPTHHQIVLDALFLTDRLFVADPLAVLRWSSRTTLWVVPVALLVLDRWWRSPRHLMAMGGALVVWTVALDPLLEPLAWKVAAYLSVRLGRISYAPALWLLILGLAWNASRARRSVWLRAAALLPLVLAAWSFVREARTSAQVMRWGPPSRSEVVWSDLRALASAFDRLPAGVPLADPRTSYGLRALRGGASALTPRAHSSPRDTALLDRLSRYRGLLDPQAPLDSIQADLRALEADYLVVNERVERSYRGEEFGFVPSDRAQRRLAARVESGGAVPVAAGPSWRVYRVPDLLALEEVAPPSRPSGPELDPAFALTEPVQASRFAVLGLRLLDSQGAAGDSLDFRVWYRARAGGARTRHPDWERLYLRFEGPLPDAPAWAGPVDKLYRKFLIERRGRSSSRFGLSWFPFDGSPPPGRWGQSLVSEVRRVHVPSYIPAGIYSLQLTVHEPIWRGNRTLRDYLSNEDSYSSPSLGSVSIDSASK